MDITRFVQRLLHHLRDGSYLVAARPSESRLRPMPACNEPPHQSLQLVVLTAAGQQNLPWEALWTGPPLQIAGIDADYFAQAAHVAANSGPSSLSHR